MLIDDIRDLKRDPEGATLQLNVRLVGRTKADLAILQTLVPGWLAPPKVVGV